MELTANVACAIDCAEGITSTPSSTSAQGADAPTENGSDDSLRQIIVGGYRVWKNGSAYLEEVMLSVRRKA